MLKPMLIAGAAACSLLPLAARAAGAPPPCPPSWGVVERSAGAAVIYLGRDPANPEICLMQRGGADGRFYYGVWNLDWPGAEGAYRALRQVYAGPPGTTVKFDTVMGPGLQWHETIRNDGFEDATGMTIYQNYWHIAGHPEPGTSWNPTAIVGGR